MAKYLKIDTNSFKSLNNNDLILLKRNFFKTILENLNESKQIDVGTELALFINNLALFQNKVNDIEYKLELCEHLGFFEKNVDKANYILFLKEFGPKKFVEAFVWQLITDGKEGDFDKTFIDSEMEGNKKLKTKYEVTIQPLVRDTSHYAFGFAKFEK